MFSYVCFILYLYFHACVARPLIVWDKENFSQLHQLPSKQEEFVTRSNLKASYGDNTSGIIQFGNRKSSAAQETETIIGSKGKTSYPLKMLPQAIATEIWRTERSTLESAPSKAEERVSSKNGDDAVEDVVVMDYALPHRKPPIHNKGT